MSCGVVVSVAVVEVGEAVVVVVVLAIESLEHSACLQVVLLTADIL
jgi:hypothetical protein